MNENRRKWSRWRKMLRTASIVAIQAAVLSGCTQLNQLFGTGEPLFSVNSGSVVGLPVVTEDAFVKILADRHYTSDPTSARQHAMEASALLNDPTVAGIEAAPVMLPAPTTGLLIVARAIEPSTGSTKKLTDFYLAAISNVTLPAGSLVATRVTRTNGDSSELSISAAIVECMVLPGPSGAPAVLAGSEVEGAGVAPGVRVNAERAHPQLNGSGQTIALNVYPSAALNLPANQFSCSRVRKLVGDPQKLPPPGTVRWTVPGSVALISEDQYQLWARSARAKPATLPQQADVTQAIHLVTAANQPGSQAIEGQWGQSGAAQPSILVVARDLTVEGTRARASEFYVVARWWPPSVEVPTAATAVNLFLDFGSTLVYPIHFDPDAGVCGPVLYAGATTPCDAGVCREIPRLVDYQGNIGTDRWQLGLNRTTFHWETTGTPPGLETGPPVPETGPSLPLPGFPPVAHGFDVNIVACSLYEPPHQSPVQRCDIDVLTGNPIVEQCNGLDDNCNGQIDEGNACSVVQTCPGQPKTCGSRTCGTMPDGCGNIIVCGGACP